MAAGTQATRQGWRWSYTTLGIFNALFLVLFTFLYEETKYTPVISGSPRPGTAEDDNPENTGDPDTKKAPSVTKASVSDEPSTQSRQLDTTIPLNSWRKRLALVTATPESIWPYYYRPFKTIFTFPAVMFAGLQYAAGVIWLTILSSVLSLVFPLPPYLFTPEQIGFMSLGPFIGNLLGAVYGGVLGDWSILYFSRRNNGFYEPEMRLYILHLPALTMAGGLVMFGATIERVSSVGDKTFCRMDISSVSPSSQSWCLVLTKLFTRECTGSILVLVEPFSGSDSAVLVMLP
jgi:hypothetical protein